MEFLKRKIYFRWFQPTVEWHPPAGVKKADGNGYTFTNSLGLYLFDRLEAISDGSYLRYLCGRKLLLPRIEIRGYKIDMPTAFLLCPTNPDRDESYCSPGIHPWE